MSKPGSRPTSPKMPASLSKRRLPNLRRYKRMARRAKASKMVKPRMAAMAKLPQKSQEK